MLYRKRPLMLSDGPGTIVSGGQRTGDEHAHVSYLVRSVAVRLGMLKPGRDLDDDDLPLSVCLGTAWEDWVIRNSVWVLGREIARLGELRKDGLIGTVDGVSENPGTGEVRVEETKLTWKSSGAWDWASVRQWMWLAQVKAYCYMADTQLASITVGHVNGNYQWLRGKVLGGPTAATTAAATLDVKRAWEWELNFERGELEDNWGVLQDERRGLKGQKGQQR